MISPIVAMPPVYAAVSHAAEWLRRTLRREVTVTPLKWHRADSKADVL